MTSKRSRAAKGKKKRKAAAATPPDDSAIESLDLLRAGMPARDSITGVKEVGKGKKVYRIIKTTEVDEYELPAKRRSKKR